MSRQTLPENVSGPGGRYCSCPKGNGNYRDYRGYLGVIRDSKKAADSRFGASDKLWEFGA